MEVKSQSEVAQLCPTLSDPMDCSIPGSSIHGIFQAKVLEWGANSFLVRGKEDSYKAKANFEKLQNMAKLTFIFSGFPFLGLLYFL